MCGGPFFLDFVYESDSVRCYVKSGRDDIIIDDTAFQKLLKNFEKYDIFESVIYEPNRRVLSVVFRGLHAEIHHDGLLYIKGSYDRKKLNRMVNMVGALTYLDVVGTDGPMMDPTPIKDRLIEHLEQKAMLDEIKIKSMKKLTELEQKLSQVLKNIGE